MGNKLTSVLLAMSVLLFCTGASDSKLGTLVRDASVRSEIKPDMAARLAVSVISKPDGAVPSWARVRYLVADPLHEDMAILEIIEGHTVALQEQVIQNTRFILVYYHNGASQYIVRIFAFVGGDFIRLSTQPGASNMRSIQSNNGIIIVQNEGPDEKGERRIISERFDIMAAFKETKH